jgi:hypothetical protein
MSLVMAHGFLAIRWWSYWTSIPFGLFDTLTMKFLAAGRDHKPLVNPMSGY